MECLAEPSTMRDNQCYTLLKFWFDRQTAGESPTFQFSHYLVGEELLPANERELLPTIMPGIEDSLVNAEPAVSRKPKPRKKGKGKAKAVSRGNGTGGSQNFKRNARDKKGRQDPHDSDEAMSSNTSSDTEIKLKSSDSEESESDESPSEHLSAGRSSRGITSSLLRSRLPILNSLDSAKSEKGLVASSPILSPGPNFDQIKAQPQSAGIKLDLEPKSDLFEDLSPDLKQVAELLANQGQGEVGVVFLRTLRGLKVGSQSSSPVKVKSRSPSTLPADSEATRKREREGSPQLTPSSPTKKSRQRPLAPEPSPSSFPRPATVLPSLVPEPIKQTHSPRKRTTKGVKFVVNSVDIPCASRSQTRASEQLEKRSTRSKPRK